MPPVILTPVSRVAPAAALVPAFAIIPTMPRDASRARRVFQALVLLAALAVAFLAGMLTERLQAHAERDAMLRRYDQALREHRARVMEAEKWQQSGAPKR